VLRKNSAVEDPTHKNLRVLTTTWALNIFVVQALEQLGWSGVVVNLLDLTDHEIFAFVREGRLDEVDLAMFENPCGDLEKSLFLLRCVGHKKIPFIGIDDRYAWEEESVRGFVLALARHIKRMEPRIMRRRELVTLVGTAR